MRLLFVKESLYWPRTVGHDVHAFEMMRALVSLGHAVGLATASRLEPRAVEGLALDEQWTLDDDRGGGRPDDGGAVAPMSYLEERYRRYWGIEPARIARLDAIAATWRADVVVAVGLEVLPYLAIRPGPVRVWYAADEWVWHYVSQLASEPGSAVAHVKAAAIKGLYERAFASRMDRVWVVSGAERRAMRLVTGLASDAIDVVPNGVDADAFAPPAGLERQPHSAVFWGRLGFGPNLQSLRWFTKSVWPLVRRQVPDARFAILGADPPDEVCELDGRDGIELKRDLPDLRPEIGRREVTVLPFVSGGGIKNKLLEAAAMGQAIVATPRATSGLRTPPPIVIASAAAEFADSIVLLWRDDSKRTRLGVEVREWVRRHHGWQQTAEAALAGLDRETTRQHAAS